MKVFVVYFITGFLPTMLLAQPTLTGNELRMTHEQNSAWLTTVKTLDKDVQWRIISERFFGQGKIRTEENGTAQYYPLLTIDGIPLSITENTSAVSKTQLMNLLTHDKIRDIKVIDKEPEGIYINKAFTGIILVTLTDKRTTKQFKKIKIE